MVTPQVMDGFRIENPGAKIKITNKKNSKNIKEKYDKKMYDLIETEKHNSQGKLRRKQKSVDSKQIYRKLFV